MRDPNLDAQSFVRGLDKHFGAKSTIAKHLQVLRNHVLVSPNLGQEIRISSLKKWKFKELVALAVATNYVEPWFADMLKERINEVTKRLPQEYQLILELLLTDYKGEALCFLIETQLWHTREFFGNIVKLGQQRILELRSYTVSYKKPKIAQRKRGYTDQGSRAPEEHRIRREALEDYHQELHLLLEDRKRSYHDTINFALGGLG